MAVAQYVNINGHNIHINIIGEGEPIIFLHGGPGSEHRFFLPHVLPLAKKYQLVLYDQRGCGKSDSILGNNYSIEEEVNTLESLRKLLQFEKINIFGESWGSMLALCYASAYPKRVSKLFLTAAIGVNQKGLKTFEKELLKRITLKDKIKLLKTDREVKKGTASVDKVLAILDPYYVFSKHSLQNNEKTSMNQTVNYTIVEDIENNYDLSEDLDRLAEIPILVAQGSHDILPPTIIEKLFINYLPHTRLHTIENCGHWTIIEKSNEINMLAEDFFSGTEGQESCPS
ncbi:alpha/beta fold hydrolase [Paucisalibacillus sp. EB02]|uniref:alpha/beta fold hydrolase n=1 Tax=Paucisalibacillus sp. EB02 TaxID=1347087 RepID=UPI0005A8F74B|nr:alpha/beta hydrolase [Paucisalibacillus sp. EB02]